MKKHSSSENIREKANPYPPYKKLPIVEKIIMKKAEIHIALFNNLLFSLTRIKTKFLKFNILTKGINQSKIKIFSL